MVPGAGWGGGRRCTAQTPFMDKARRARKASRWAWAKPGGASRGTTLQGQGLEAMGGPKGFCRSYPSPFWEPTWVGRMRRSLWWPAVHRWRPGPWLLGSLRSLSGSHATSPWPPLNPGRGSLPVTPHGCKPRALVGRAQSLASCGPGTETPIIAPPDPRISRALKPTQSHPAGALPLPLPSAGGTSVLPHCPANAVLWGAQGFAGESLLLCEDTTPRPCLQPSGAPEARLQAGALSPTHGAPAREQPQSVSTFLQGTQTSNPARLRPGLAGLPGALTADPVRGVAMGMGVRGTKPRAGGQNSASGASAVSANDTGSTWSVSNSARGSWAQNRSWGSASAGQGSSMLPQAGPSLGSTRPASSSTSAPNLASFLGLPSPSASLGPHSRAPLVHQQLRLGHQGPTHGTAPGSRACSPGAAGIPGAALQRWARPMGRRGTGGMPMGHQGHPGGGAC